LEALLKEEGQDDVGQGVLKDMLVYIIRGLTLDSVFLVVRLAGF
jgi:hypothetical protein